VKQQVPKRPWSTRREAGRRPRLLIEDDHQLAISDFSLFHDAGFDVAFCSGPGADPQACPLLHGQPCVMVAGADVVLHGLDPELGIAAAIRRDYPGCDVVIEQRGGSAGAHAEPGGNVLLGYPCSVRGEIDALLRAADRD
jgi:hypothetical protein